MAIPVIRIPIEIDSRPAQRNLRDLRFQFNILEREAKSVGKSFSGSLAAMRKLDLANAASSTGLNKVAGKVTKRSGDAGGAFFDHMSMSSAGGMLSAAARFDSAIDKATEGETRLGDARRKTGSITEGVATTTLVYRERLHGLEAPLTGVTGGTGSLTAAVKKNRTAFDEMADSANRADTSLGNVKVKAKETKTVLDQLAESSDRLGQAVGKAFEDAVVNGKDLRSVLKALEKDLLRILLKEFGVTGKDNIFSKIIKEAFGISKAKSQERTTITVAVKDSGLAEATLNRLNDDFDFFEEAQGLDDIGNAAANVTGGLNAAAAAAGGVSAAMQTNALDTLAAAAKTTLLGAAEDTASSAIFELAAAARVASSALNSVGASKGSGLGGLFDFGGALGANIGLTDFGELGIGAAPFSHGGRFTVRGPAGIDNLLTPLRLTAGERVTVETPAQQKANDHGMTINNNITMTINTPDSQGFRQSQNQIVADLQRALDRAKRIQ